MEHWFKSDLTIFGEARSFDHLTSLPTSILVGDEEKYNAKYLGGLKIGMRFRNLTDIKKFMENTDVWKLCSNGLRKVIELKSRTTGLPG